MPTPERVDRGQYAVLWEANGYDRDGQVKVKSPRQIDVGWESGRREAIDDNAEPIASSATVDVNEEIPVHSLMRLGKLANLPDDLNKLHQVIDYNEVPDVKGDELQRTVTLTRWKKPLPTIAD